MARAPREVYVTPLDVDLLAALQATGSIVDACARLGIGRDRGMYRLRRLSRAAGSPVVASHRGGALRGRTVLTAEGRDLLRRGTGPLPTGSAVRGRRSSEGNVLEAVWHARPQAHVTVAGDLDLFVTFAAHEGETVRVGIEPEAIVVARGRFRSSARNVLQGTVESQETVDAMRVLLRIRVGQRTRLDVAVTPRSRRELGLSRGARVFLYVKATAIVPLP